MKRLFLFWMIAGVLCFGQQTTTTPPPDQNTAQPAPEASQAAPTPAQPAPEASQPAPSPAQPAPEAGQVAPSPTQAQPSATPVQVPPCPVVVAPSTTPSAASPALPVPSPLPPGSKLSEDGFGIKDLTFLATLLSPLSTKTAKPGDTFTATVESPTQYVGAVIEGKINSLNKPKKGIGKGQATIEFEFDSMTFQGKTSLMSIQLTEVANSKGVKNVDDEGRAIGKTSNKKRVGMAFGGAALGALAGYALGGASGAMIGAGVGAAAGLATAMTMTTTGSEIEFKPGSKFTLSVSDPSKQEKKKLGKK